MRRWPTVAPGESRRTLSGGRRRTALSSASAAALSARRASSRAAWATLPAATCVACSSSCRARSRACRPARRSRWKATLSSDQPQRRLSSAQAASRKISWFSRRRRLRAADVPMERVLAGGCAGPSPSRRIWKSSVVTDHPSAARRKCSTGCFVPAALARAQRRRCSARAAQACVTALSRMERVNSRSSGWSLISAVSWRPRSASSSRGLNLSERAGSGGGGVPSRSARDLARRYVTPTAKGTCGWMTAL